MLLLDLHAVARLVLDLPLDLLLALNPMLELFLLLARAAVGAETVAGARA